VYRPGSTPWPNAALLTVIEDGASGVRVFAPEANPHPLSRTAMPVTMAPRVMRVRPPS